MAHSLASGEKFISPETDLAKAIQNSVLEKRFSDTETRLREEQKAAEARHASDHERIEARLDRLETRFDRLEDKIDGNHKWTIGVFKWMFGLLIAILLAIFGVLFAVVAPYVAWPF